MAQYKTVPWDTLEHTELARKAYVDYERSLDCPDEAKTEADWIAKRKRIRAALSILSPRQREVFMLRIVNQLTEAEIADKLKIAQQVVSRRYRKAQEKLTRYAVENTK